MLNVFVSISGDVELAVVPAPMLVTPELGNIHRESEKFSSIYSRY